MKFKAFSFLLFLCLISCQKKETPKNKFTGTWYDTEYIVPGKSSIKINADSSFNYRGAGCDWRVFSKGKWRMIGDSIELNSTKIDTCYIAFPFLDCTFFDRKDKAPLPLLTMPNCEPDEGKSFCLFTKEIFYIKNDSLICKVKPESKCPDTLKIIFAKTQKIRK
ncbi:hypothetical protein [Flavobacterium reichenbachii]|uniref:Lipocalin-like domain-containing protein n=1 Tax=Flavobacterium reichenbachii TaxID=362418 RepID=A0A085ZE46_9FLAO|nr:hypothetical protein [Flavobacterium reichenbachii]KFF02710.1 hypothetical protein IW19_23920 [Flavobacterium reichenbachii]OXB10743.1 hypothetical protein B0A68_21975 [Flavobacterium reichenbachii]